MAIVLVENDNFLVHDVRTGRNDRDEPYVTWDLRGLADAYVVCAAEGPAVVYEDVCELIPDSMLAELYKDGYAEVTLDGARRCRLWGISRRTFEASSSRFTIDVQAPIHIQVWSMKSEYRKCILYVPAQSGDECATVPTHYGFEFSAGKPAKRWKPSCLSYLRIHLENPDQYEDGALQYTSGGCLPIPVPRELLGYDIPLMLAHPENGVVVSPASGWELEYIPY